MGHNNRIPAVPIPISVTSGMADGTRARRVQRELLKRELLKRELLTSRLLKYVRVQAHTVGYRSHLIYQLRFSPPRDAYSSQAAIRGPDTRFRTRSSDMLDELCAMLISR
jgi:hypothetical protein